MNEPDASTGRPPWWDECEAMSFGDLRQLLDDRLDALEAGAVGDDGPQTEEDFKDLADMLDSKIEAMREEIPEKPPTPTTPPGYAPYMSYSFEPSTELHHMQRGLEELEELREEIRYDYRDSSRREFDRLQRDIAEQRARVKEKEAEERKDYPRRLEAAREADRVHASNMRRWRKQVNELARRRESLDHRATFVERRRQRIEAVFKSAAGPTTKKLRWRLLPKGRVSREGLRRHYEDLHKKNPGVTYDQERIEKAMDLGPETLHEEVDGVEGYIVFTFAHTPSVLLECPRVGNAIYVIHHDWELWSQMTKQQLMADTSGAVVRIPHQGDWHTRVKKELGIQ